VSSGRNGATRDPSGAMPSEASLPPAVYIPCIGPIKKTCIVVERGLCILWWTTSLNTRTDLSNPALFLLFLQPNPIPKPHANIFRVSCQVYVGIVSMLYAKVQLFLM
jgi:hypothetical protein